MAYPVPKKSNGKRDENDVRNEANIPWDPSFDKQSKESSFEMGSASDWMNTAGILTTTMGNKGLTSKIVSGGMAVGLLKSGITGLAMTAGFSCVPILNVISAISLFASLFQDDEDNSNEQIMEMVQHNTQILSKQIGETYIQLRNQGVYILNQLDSVKLEMLNEFIKASEQRWNLKEDLLEMQRDIQMRLENTTHLTLMVYGSVNERLNQMEPLFYTGVDDRVSSTLNEALLACREDISLDVYQDLFRKVATIATLTSLGSPMTGSEITLSENEKVISALTSGRGRTLYGMNMNLFQQMYEEITESKIEPIPNLELLSACVHTLASLMDNQLRSEENPSDRTLISEWNCIEDIAELTCRVVKFTSKLLDVLVQLVKNYSTVRRELDLVFRERRKNFKNELRDNYIAVRRSKLRNEYNSFSAHTIKFGNIDWKLKYKHLYESDVLELVTKNNVTRTNAWNIQQLSRGLSEIQREINHEIPSIAENSFAPALPTCISYLTHSDSTNISYFFQNGAIVSLMYQPDLVTVHKAEFLQMGEVKRKYTWNNSFFTINTYIEMNNGNLLQVGKKSLPLTFNPPDYFSLDEKIWHCVSTQLSSFSSLSVVNHHCQQFQDNINQIIILVNQKEKELEDNLRSEMILNSEVYLKRKKLDAHYYRLKALSQFMFDNDSFFNIGISSDVLEERKDDYIAPIITNIRNPLINNIVLTLARLKRDYGDRDLPNQHIDNLLGLWHPPI